MQRKLRHEWGYIEATGLYACARCGHMVRRPDEWEDVSDCQQVQAESGGPDPEREDELRAAGWEPAEPPATSERIRQMRLL